MHNMWKRSLISIFLLILLGATLASLGVAAPDPATIYVDPQSIADETLTPGSTFSIDVTASGVTDLWGYTVRLSYNLAILKATGFTSYDPFTDASPSIIDNSGNFTIRPSLNGAYHNWTGTYQYWDDVEPDDDANYVYVAASNLTQSSALASAPLTSSWDAVTKVNVTIVARQTTGDEKVMPVLVIGSDVYNGSAVTPTASYASYSSEWTTNPKTGSAWTLEEIDTLEAGAKSLREGATWDGEIRVTQLYVVVYNTAGIVSVTYSMPFGVTQGVSGTLPLVKIDFTVDGLGVSELDLHHTALTDPLATPIAHDDIDGDFTNIDTHNIIIKSVTPSASRVATAGEPIDINVILANDGDFDETFNVTLSYDGTYIENQTDIFLEIDENTTLTFTWDTTGVANGEYTLHLQAEIELDNYPDDNTRDIKVRIGVMHDIVVVSVSPDPMEVYLGESVIITIVVENRGNFTESFSVNASYNGNTIGTSEVNNLEIGKPNSVSITWWTTDEAAGEYTIRAEAVVAVDDDLTNNSLESIPVQLGSAELPISWIYGGYALLGLIVVAVSLYVLNKVRKRKKQS